MKMAPRRYFLPGGYDHQVTVPKPLQWYWYLHKQTILVKRYRLKASGRGRL